MYTSQPDEDRAWCGDPSACYGRACGLATNDITPAHQIAPNMAGRPCLIQLPVLAPENQIEDYGSTLQQAAESELEAAVRLFART